MKVVLFYHSILSCWNHGNAHFLRGIARELLRLGHTVEVHEPEDGWSRTNAIADGGAEALAEAAALVPGVKLHSYRQATPDLDRAIDGASLVIVHEWNTPALVAALGRRRTQGGRFTLLFHDTHHRAITAPREIDALELDGYDGVLAYGAVLRDMYVARGWARRAYVWHEAADTALFRPLTGERVDTDLIWVGNWGDDERGRELHAFLIEPVRRLGLRARVHGVRYPDAAREQLAWAGIDYAGWLPNHRAPEAFARTRLTVHVPRRPYAEALPGIPTIRVFEALACGIPLVSSPWRDEEQLFPCGAYLTAQNTEEMCAAMSLLLRDRDMARSMSEAGLRAIRERHSCAHRATELLAIVDGIGDAIRSRSSAQPELRQAAAS
jgi:spore maturation protein CgeB